MRTLFKSVVGSRLFGTNTPDSDLDYYSIYVPSREQILTGDYDHFIKDNTSGDNVKNTENDVDHTANSIKEYLRLLKMGDIHATEMLFVEKDQAEVWSEEWNIIHENRMYFVDHRLPRFRGFIANKIKFLEKNSKDNEKDMYHLFRICSEVTSLLLMGELKFPLDEDDINNVKQIRSGKIPKEEILRFSKDCLRFVDSTVTGTPKGYFENFNEMFRLQLLYVHTREVERVAC